MLLQRSLVKVKRRPGNLAQDKQQLAGLLQVGIQQLRLARNVATTSSSKIQQIALRRAKSEKQDQTELGHNSNSQHNSAEIKYRARLENMNLWHSVDTIKKLGFRLAQLDPLELGASETLRDISWTHELTEQLRQDSNIVATQGFLDTKQPLMAVNELIDTVWSIYTRNNCGLEFGHMSNQVEIEWLTSQWEKLNETHHLDQLDQHNFAKLMLESEAFDQFLAAKYPTVKRYGCEGAEPMLVVLDEILRLSHLGAADINEMTQSIGRIDDIIIGMPHRGRLNLLACLLGFEPMAIMQRIRGEPELDLAKAWMASGDVLSHLSTNTRYVYGLDRHHIGLSRNTPDPINVTVLPNPSHLEIVSPVTVGAARGRAHNHLHGYSSSPKFVTFNERSASQAREQQTGRKHQQQPPDAYDYRKYLQNILPIQIHGDASVAGQGIIQETLQMANLGQFTAGGSLHLICNNQIGFTTDSQASRSSRHCSDIFKMIEAPIIHVNAQNISSVVRATLLALTYRQKFGKDVAINLVCYRQMGHNEMDEPSYTQPIMYKTIKARKSIPQVYCDEIGMDELERRQIVDEFKAQLQLGYKNAERYKPDNDNYRNFKLPTEYHRDHICAWQTGCSLEMLQSVALASVELPTDFKVHPNLARVLVSDRRQKFLASSSSAATSTTNKQSPSSAQMAQIKVDWATAEILAFGSLLKQNHSVRLAGQDVARGTFSTRHAILFDQNSGRPYCPLNEMVRGQQSISKYKAQLEVAPTVLSEEAALAYEFGYSAETCELTIWEAQFGDFHNTAQSIIDTLISSSEAKWLKQSPLTLLLPHGLDGAGPEHSSARIERFLQLSNSSFDSIDTEAKCNWSICFPTQPSQYFHLLRRQVLRPFRKPLIVFSPKIIFRHPNCQSDLGDFGLDKSFKPILDDPTVEDRHSIDTIVLCSGKIYFTLEDLKHQHQVNNVAIVRIEELCPFPIQSIAETIRKYPGVKATNIIWFQEEHKNQGAYSYVAPRLANTLANVHLQYIGREESALPATGCTQMHKKEFNRLIREFCSLKT